MNLYAFRTWSHHLSSSSPSSSTSGSALSTTTTTTTTQQSTECVTDKTSSPFPAISPTLFTTNSSGGYFPGGYFPPPPGVYSPFQADSAKVASDSGADPNWKNPDMCLPPSGEAGQHLREENSSRVKVFENCPPKPTNNIYGLGVTTGQRSCCALSSCTCGQGSKVNGVMDGSAPCRSQSPLWRSGDVDMSSPGDWEFNSTSAVTTVNLSSASSSSFVGLYPRGGSALKWSRAVAINVIVDEAARRQCVVETVMAFS
ncbi:hypothetical protein ACOMHN_063718 [Nucella lapillus]